VSDDVVTGRRFEQAPLPPTAAWNATPGHESWTGGEQRSLHCHGPIIPRRCLDDCATPVPGREVSCCNHLPTESTGHRLGRPARL